MCLFESLRRDGILSASHFTAHRNHPTEDDYRFRLMRFQGILMMVAGRERQRQSQRLLLALVHEAAVGDRGDESVAATAAAFPRTTQLCGKRQKATSL